MIQFQFQTIDYGNRLAASVRYGNHRTYVIVPGRRWTIKRKIHARKLLRAWGRTTLK